MKKIITVLAFTSLLFQTSAQAATGLAVFNGTILSTCVVTVGTPGILTASSDYTALSSANAGGLRSAVSVLTTGSTFNVSAIAPSSFTLGDSSNVNFTSDYSLTGITNLGVTAGSTTTLLGVGNTNVSVGLTATKTSGAFAAGNYTGAVTVRCE